MQAFFMFFEFEFTHTNVRQHGKLKSNIRKTNLFNSKSKRSIHSNNFAGISRIARILSDYKIFFTRKLYNIHIKKL